MTNLDNTWRYRDRHFDIVVPLAGGTELAVSFGVDIQALPCDVDTSEHFHNVDQQRNWHSKQDNWVVELTL